MSIRDIREESLWPWFKQWYLCLQPRLYYSLKKKKKGLIWLYQNSIFSSVKYTIKKMKKQATKRVPAYHISDKTFKSRIYKELSKFNNKKNNNSIKM